MEKYRRGNSAAESEASALASYEANPDLAIGQVRALCLVAAAPSAMFVEVGTPVAVLSRDGSLLKVKVLEARTAEGLPTCRLRWSPTRR